MSASACANERAVETAVHSTLDSTQRLLEYALLLGLSRAEAVAYLHRASGLQPALTEMGALARRHARAGWGLLAADSFPTPRAVWDKLAAQNSAYFIEHEQRVARRVRSAAWRPGGWLIAPNI
jgi:hypothetical protein